MTHGASAFAIRIESQDALAWDFSPTSVETGERARGISPPRSTSARSAATAAASSVGAQPTWLSLALKRVSAISHFVDNWDNCDAPAPESHVIESARMLLVGMVEYDIIPTHVDASVEGGISIAILRGDRYAHIEVSNSGAILGATSVKSESPDIWDFDERGLRTSLADIENFLG